ncbi:hypothetical protein [Mucilaginibacter flavus]|uniref:hypothetical protein n=1 Tax=Mucilaginibacter flavus TaxID=931504 RepID=UPI0025B45E22|nr:hypothetical protein [Mucilaginibacter flavus]MDN3584409.1 hypothetical protein [Mucilaginibacter flavus]
MLKRIKDTRRMLPVFPGHFARLENEPAEQKPRAAKAAINSLDYSLDGPIIAYGFNIFSDGEGDQIGIIRFILKFHFFGELNHS